MELAAITALGIGGATVAGAVIGFAFKNISQKHSDAILGFAAGIMLAASIFGLIIPAIEFSEGLGIWITVAGIFSGALFINFADRLVPHLHHITGLNEEEHRNNTAVGKILLFVLAVAIHNFPEGMAAGIGFGSGDNANAVTMAIGIALQNIPEGIIIISPLLSTGLSKKRTFAIASATGLIEVAGTFFGYFAASVSGAILPFVLAFAAGTMLYVISDEMIPDTHSSGNEQTATYSLLAGISVMLIIDYFLG